jgi:hypothetical protein
VKWDFTGSSGNQQNLVEQKQNKPVVANSNVGDKDDLDDFGLDEND